MPLGAARFGLSGGLLDLGKLVHIQTQSASNVNVLDFTSIQEDVYDVHFVTVSNFHATGSSISGAVRLYENGVLESAGVYNYAYQEQDVATGTVTENRSTSATGTGIDYDFDPVTPRNNYFFLYNAGDSNKYTSYTWHYTGINNGGIVYKFGSGVLPQSSVVDGFRLYSGNLTINFDVDNVSLYGIAKS